MHVAVTRESRLMFEAISGLRDELTAQQLVGGVAERSASNGWPLWLTTGWKAYQPAILSFFSMVIHFI
jgi:hypothetical protein